MFFVNFKDSAETSGILKIYQNEEIKSYQKEIEVFKKLETVRKDPKSKDLIVGFPKLYSFLEGPDSSEIVMEVLGNNIRALTKKTPKGALGKASVYQLTI